MADDKAIKQTLRRLEYGVYVVSMGKGQEGNAFTGSWISQVSSEPPMVAIAVHNKHQSARLLNEAPAFVINILTDNGVAVAKAYYGPAESGYQKLQAKEVTAAPATGTPVLAGASGWLDCKIVNRVVTGNHTLYVGEVLAASPGDSGAILTTTSSKLHYTG
jgi:flavin reductase (DIM6/NTAB) family NADH-FMN oxidoreductase RutF